MSLTITEKLSLILVALFLSACGALSQEASLEIHMYGVARVPEGATGTRDPDFQTYTIQSIVLTRDGAEPLEVLAADQSIKIVDRPQILLKMNTEELKDQTFTGIRATFAPEVSGGDGKKSDLSFTLSATDFTMTEPFTIKEGGSKTFVLKALWSNTLSDTAMSEPSFTFTPN